MTLLTLLSLLSLLFRPRPAQEPDVATDAPPRRSDLTGLQPAFRLRLARVLSELERMDFKPQVWETVRTAERQAWLHEHRPGSTRTARLGAHGEGRAADVIDGRAHPTRSGKINGWGAWDGSDRGDEAANAAAAAFFEAFGEVAERHGLVWGGRWRGFESDHGSGDRTHVELPASAVA